MEEDGIIDVKSDPKALLLLNYEQENKLCCSLLDSKDFNGWQLRLDEPKFVKQKTLVMTRP